MAKKVFLSAGHGGKDPGAVGFGLKEKDINLNVMLACAEVLERHGLDVVTSRTKDEDDPVGKEVKEANDCDADLAVSFHTNAGGGNGSETFCNLNNKDAKRLAELCEKYTKELGQNSRGVKSGMHLYFIKNTKMTAILCEIGFIDNDKDNDIFDTVAEQKKFGVAYARAILEFLEIDYKEDSKVENKPVTKPISKPTSTVKKGYTGVFPVMPPRGYFTEGDGIRVLKNYPTQIKRVQSFLNWAIDAGLKVDGKYGGKTTVAVKEFQKLVGFKRPDGEFGPATLAKAKAFKK